MFIEDIEKSYPLVLGGWGIILVLFLDSGNDEFELSMKAIMKSICSKNID